MFRRTAVVFLALILAATVALAGQGPHRARLSADLEQHLAAPAVPTRGGHRHGQPRRNRGAGRAPRPRRRNGGSPRAPSSTWRPAALQALADDDAVAHLSGDVPVRGTMAVTGESIGADQVWAGLAGLKGYSGAGVGIALIDSGVARLPAIQKRIVASVDFTASGSAARLTSSATGRTSRESSPARRPPPATAAWRPERTSST